MSILTVTSSAEDRSLLTIAELRAAAGLPSGSGADDAALTVLGNRVASSIVTACRLIRAGATPPTLRLETLSETFRLTCNRPELVLARRPVTAVTSITENGTLLDSSAYEADAAAGLLYRLSSDTRICWPGVKIVAVYQAGWATVPSDLALAAAKLAKHFWAEGRRSDPNLRSEEIPGVISKTWWVGPKDDPAIPGEVLDLLAPYRNHVIG